MPAMGVAAKFGCAGIASLAGAVLLACAGSPDQQKTRPTAEETAPPPVDAELVGDDVVCSTALPEVETHYLVVDATETEVLHGVYGLGGLKNGVPIPRPAAGDPVTWDGVDHEGALAKQLVLEGANGESAERAIERNGDRWFAPGLRVLFVPGPEVRAALGVDGLGVLAVELEGDAATSPWWCPLVD